MAKKESALDVSMLSNADVRNLALQRTTSLKSFSIFQKRISPSYHLWSRYGTDTLLKAEVSTRRDAIINIAVQEIEEEFEEIWKYLGDADVHSIMDIGCGLGIIDTMFGSTGRVSRIALVDIETNDRKHHGFQDQGSGYNSLTTSREFVASNVVNGVEILTINPNIDLMTPERIGKYGLIMSLISCGFHYPAITYLDKLKLLLNEDGVVLLDLRHGIDHSDFLREFKIFAEIVNNRSYKRVLLKRG